MKSNNALVGIALLFLILAVSASVTLWGEVSSPVKIGMYAFGFATGILVGTLIARRRQSL
jgi:tellurite resistance protein TehA-like permease